MINFSQVICTPHLGANTIEAQKRVAEEIGEQIVSMIKGHPLVGVINAPALSNALNDKSKPWILLAEYLGYLAESFIGDKLSSHKINMQVFGKYENYHCDYYINTFFK